MIPHSSPWITDDDVAAVSAVLRSGMVAKGEGVAAFESAVARRVGGGHCTATSSGSIGISHALAAVGVRQGDEVILPSYVCSSVQASVERIGALPRFADIGTNGTLTADCVAAIFGPRVRAIVAVHIFGQYCALDTLRQFGVPLIEDACQSFGPFGDAGWAGTFGDVGVFSFHATKCLATGEGGMVVWPGSPRADGAAGEPEDDSPMSDLQAALGLAQLARYEQFLERRRALRVRFTSAAAARADLVAHHGEDDCLFRFTLLSEKGYEFARAFFADRGVTARRGVDSLLHRNVGLPDAGFPNTTRLFERTISIPFYPALTDADADQVANAVREFANVH